MNTDQKVADFAAREFRKIMPNLIVETEQGRHLVFGRYFLEQHHNAVKIYNAGGDLMAEFHNKRAAVSFCVAEKFRRYNLAIQIKNLDAKVQILANDIACRRGVANHSNRQEFKELVENKLSGKVQQHKAVASELEKCINLAKYLQIKGFQNETARVFPSQTH